MLEESLYSFLQQDYPSKELIIVNDYPLQKLTYNHPEVKIVNLDKTFGTIGEKENFATELCNGDVICQWDDDDVALPNHLSNVAEQFTDDVNILHWKTGVYYNEPNITEVGWIGNSGIVFRKSAWKAVGGHPIENAGYDMTFVQTLHKYGGMKIAEMSEGVSKSSLLATGSAAGIGFTVAIFIANLAFSDSQTQDIAVLAVIAASVISALLSTLIFKMAARK